MTEPFIVYYLENEEGRNYTGYTSNLTRRLRQHNSTNPGKKAYTAGKGPWRVVAMQGFNTATAAREEEKGIKSNALYKKYWISTHRI